MMLEKYSLALAIENCLLVLLLTIGLLFVTRLLKRRNELIGELATFGSLLIVVGHLLNAVSKLVSATTGHDLVWMKNGLLFLSAPGFVCLAWALWRSNQEKITAGAVWLLPLFFNGGLFALTSATKMVKGGQTWLKLLLTVVTIASIAVFTQLAFQALRKQQTVTAVLFILSLGMTLALTFRSSDSSEAAEWGRQISGTIAQGIFAVAAFNFYRLGSSEK